MHNRRKFLIQGALAAGATALLKPLEGFSKVLSYTGVKGYESLTILHTSDLHIAATGSIGNTDVVSTNLFSIRNTIKDVRTTNPNIVLLHNGNIYNENEVDATAQNQYFSLMNGTGYDAMVVGHKDNYEVNTSLPPVVDSLENNIFSDSKALPYRIVKKGNIKAGIISNAANNNFPIASKAAALSNTAEYLKKTKKCNVVICLSTGNKKGNNVTPLQNDVEMASLSSNVDIILSGNNEVEKPINRICINANKEEVIVHSASIEGSAVGRIDIEFNEKLQKQGIKVCHNSQAVYK